MLQNLCMQDQEKIQQSPKKASVIKQILFFIGLAVLIGIIIQVMAEAYVDTIPKKKVHDKNLVPIETSAFALEKEFEQNSDSAIVKYKDKLLIITGVVESIDKYHSGESFLVFKAVKDKNPILIECLFIENKESLDSIKKGENVTVKGYLEFKSDKVVLTESQIISPVH